MYIHNVCDTQYMASKLKHWLELFKRNPFYRGGVRDGVVVQKTQENKYTEKLRNLTLRSVVQCIQLINHWYIMLNDSMASTALRLFNSKEQEVHVRKKKKNPEQNTVRRVFHFGESLPVRVVQRACFFFILLYTCLSCMQSFWWWAVAG